MQATAQTPRQAGRCFSPPAHSVRPFLACLRHPVARGAARRRTLSRSVHVDAAHEACGCAATTACGRARPPPPPPEQGKARAAPPRASPDQHAPRRAAPPPPALPLARPYDRARRMPLSLYSGISLCALVRADAPRPVGQPQRRPGRAGARAGASARGVRRLPPRSLRCFEPFLFDPFLV